MGCGPTEDKVQDNVCTSQPQKILSEQSYHEEEHYEEENLVPITTQHLVSEQQYSLQPVSSYIQESYLVGSLILAQTQELGQSNKAFMNIESEAVFQPFDSINPFNVQQMDMQFQEAAATPAQKALQHFRRKQYTQQQELQLAIQEQAPRSNESVKTPTLLREMQKGLRQDNQDSQDEWLAQVKQFKSTKTQQNVNDKVEAKAHLDLKRQHPDDDLDDFLADLAKTEYLIEEQQQKEKQEEFAKLESEVNDLIQVTASDAQKQRQLQAVKKRKYHQFRESQKVMANENYKEAVLKEREQQRKLEEEVKNSDESYYSSEICDDPEEAARKQLELEQQLSLKAKEKAEITLKQNGVVQPQQIIPIADQPEFLAIFENDFVQTDVKTEVNVEKSDSFVELLELDLLQSRKHLEVVDDIETEQVPQLPLFEEQIVELQKDEQRKIHMNELVQYCYDKQFDVSLDFIMDLNQFFDSGFRAYFNEEDYCNLKVMFSIINGQDIKPSRHKVRKLVDAQENEAEGN